MTDDQFFGSIDYYNDEDRGFNLCPGWSWILNEKNAAPRNKLRDQTRLDISSNNEKENDK